jgi:ABC-type uncharacterized transport system permease subunit
MGWALGGDGRGVAIHLTPLPPWPMPGLADLPVLGPLLFTLPPLSYLGLALTGGLEIFLRRTQAGLVLRATGENLDAVFAAGADPLRVRMYAVVAGGAVAGLGGAVLALQQVSGFTEQHDGRARLYGAGLADRRALAPLGRGGGLSRLWRGGGV